MSPTLTPDSTLEALKKQAKRWLKAIRAGDKQAQQRLLAATGLAPAVQSLRHVQLALAREYGLPGWSALRQAVEDMHRSHAERVEIVLRSAMWQGDWVSASRILARWPNISAENLYTAVATGNLEELQRRLAADPAAANRKGGPLNWEPLLYLAYARLPGGESHALEIARLLLDRGADPNACWIGDWGPPAFTVLTGVIGEGEENSPRHLQAVALASLLIDAGAHPFDAQALYNTSLLRDDCAWLDMLWAQSARHGKLECWTEVSSSTQIGGSIPLNALDYLLSNAVGFNHPQRVQWLLRHGANANCMQAYSQRPLREEALVRGHTSVTELLVLHGAAALPLEGESAFRTACMQLDRETARTLAARNPEYLQDAWLMLTAAEANRSAVVALLLELGMNVDSADGGQLRGLQAAVRGDARDVVNLLIRHGADVDRPTTGAGGGALGFAAHFKRRELADLLAPLSHDVGNLVYLRMKQRLSELFGEDPSLVNPADPKSGCIPLFWLPDDEDEAVEMTTFLLAYGADAGLTNNDGITAEEAARKRGLADAADLMRASRKEHRH
jgi:ankyrin repeat protein